MLPFKIMKKIFLPTAVAVLAAVSCAKADFVPEVQSPDKAMQVAFCTSDAAFTKSHILGDGLSSAWDEDDCLVLWAENSAGEYTLEAVPFKVYGLNDGKAIFTANISEPMPSGFYSYFAASPAPKSLNGTTATFEIPSVQDGTVSAGADILVAEPLKSGALEPVQQLSDYTRLNLKMDHLLHHFRFFIQQGQNPFGSENVEKIVLQFTEGVAGQISTDLKDPLTAPQFNPTSSEITLNLAKSLTESSSEEQALACVSLRPGAFSDDATMIIKSYTATHYGISEPISLAGRAFESGHSTPVRLTAATIYDYGRIKFTFSHNNIGEKPTSITLTAPEGCAWGKNDSNVYTYAPDRPIEVGENWEFQFEEISDYRAFSGKTVTVTYDSEHVTWSDNITMPDMSSSSLTQISSGLPYLLEEDFSNVESFSSNDGYSMSNSGDKGAYSFLNGWSGGRIGAEAGKCVRTAARRETSARYHARLDSAPIVALKKASDIEVSFDYGSDTKYGGLFGGDYGQDVFIGYVTEAGGLSSGSGTGTFDRSLNTFNTHEKTGSYNNTPNSVTFVLSNVPAGLVRISWKAEVENHAGANNTTDWLYIDNIKVRIKSN